MRAQSPDADVALLGACHPVLDEVGLLIEVIGKHPGLGSALRTVIARLDTLARERDQARASNLGYIERALAAEGVVDMLRRIVAVHPAFKMTRNTFDNKGRCDNWFVVGPCGQCCWCALDAIQAALDGPPVPPAGASEVARG